MMDNSEIRKRCFLHSRFNQSLLGILNKHKYLSDGVETNFEDVIKHVLENVILIAKKQGELLIPSNYYAQYYKEDTGLQLKKGNPFYITDFSTSLGISAVFILLKDCKNYGYIEDLIIDTGELTDHHIVCAFDLFNVDWYKKLYRLNG